MARQEKRDLTDSQRIHLENLVLLDMHPKNREYVNRILRLGWYFVRDSKMLTYLGTNTDSE